jgi:hypothetical protein
VIRKQLIVLGGCAPALVAVILMYQNAAQLFARVKLPADDTASRLAFVTDWLILPGISLLAGIIAASQRRFFSVQAIDGTRAPPQPSLEINLRYNHNTLEQSVLAHCLLDRVSAAPARTGVWHGADGAADALRFCLARMACAKLSEARASKYGW